MGIVNFMIWKKALHPNTLIEEAEQALKRAKEFPNLVLPFLTKV